MPKRTTQPPPKPRRFLIRHPHARDVVVELPHPGGKGLAVEVWLAFHGMLGYDTPPGVTATGLPATEGWSVTDVNKVIGSIDPKGWAWLDTYHKWQEKVDTAGAE